MSKYRYTLQNYHAIKEADIIIDGITVLAGENGSGKSTLSRWLYYVINGVAKFESILFQEYLNYVLNILGQWRLVSRDIMRIMSPYKQISNNRFAFINKIKWT